MKLGKLDWGDAILKSIHTHAFKALKPIGRCIYCGAANRTLTDEHIFPAGLEGKVVLKDASCEECAKITRDFEQYCLRRMFWPVRAKLHLPLKPRHKDSKPTGFNLGFAVGDGPVTKVEIETENYPATLTLPVLQLPTILRDEPPTTEFKDAEKWQYRFWDEADMVKLARENQATRVHIGEFNVLKFSQLLAKIAHCTAVAELGVDGFKPYLNDLILGGANTASHWIGGTGTVAPLVDGQILDAIIDYAPGRSERLINRDYLLPKVRVFGLLGAPEYIIVIGDRAAPTT